MSALVSITRPKSEAAAKMLISSLSFIQPVSKINLEGDILIRMHEADCKEEVEHNLDILCEASTIDFSYRFKIE